MDDCQHTATMLWSFDHMAGLKQKAYAHVLSADSDDAHMATAGSPMCHPQVTLDLPLQLAYTGS